MRRSSKKLPKDPNQLAREIVRLSTEEEEEKPKVPDQTQAEAAISAYLSLIGKKGGLKGGPARAKKLSTKKRKEIAKKAAKARWIKKD
jgi:transposase